MSDRFRWFTKFTNFFASTRLTAAQSRSRNTVMPPVAAANVVFMATCAAKAPSLPDFMVNVEPGLKPYQPNLKENTEGILTTRKKLGNMATHIQNTGKTPRQRTSKDGENEIQVGMV